MEFAIQLAHLATGPRPRLYVPFSASMLHAITFEIIHRFPARTGLVTFQDNGKMCMKFTDVEWTVDFRMIGMKDFLVQFEIYWGDVVGGRSVVYLENCLALPTDPVLLSFSSTLKGC